MTRTTTLVVIDAQREYIAEGRPFHMAGIAPSLANLRRLLGHARTNAWRVVHVQHVQAANVFVECTEYARFIDGFEPEPGETLITKAQLSAFTNVNFGYVLAQAEGDIFVAGYGSPMCCLATIISGAAQGVKTTFVHDASWALGRNGLSEAEMHRGACAILSIHAKAMSTDECLGQQPQRLAA